MAPICAAFAHTTCTYFCAHFPLRMHNTCRARGWLRVRILGRKIALGSRRKIRSKANSAQFYRAQCCDAAALSTRKSEINARLCINALPASRKTGPITLGVFRKRVRRFAKRETSAAVELSTPIVCAKNRPCIEPASAGFAFCSINCRK